MFHVMFSLTQIFLTLYRKISGVRAVVATVTFFSSKKWQSHILLLGQHQEVSGKRTYKELPVNMNSDKWHCMILC